MLYDDARDVLNTSDTSDDVHDAPVYDDATSERITRWWCVGACTLALASLVVIVYDAQT